LLGYFNSLRELGGTRRIVEDEVGNRLQSYGARKRVGEATGVFKDRKIAYEVVELTSRVSTNKVAEAKARLGKSFNDPEKAWVDVALATNMISVGLDIVRLGLMVVFAQPKTSAEYIQATSRVGRDHNRPGLVVTILNVHRPRDRSHTSGLAAITRAYRHVEATSVTPSPRLTAAGWFAGELARQGDGDDPLRGAADILRARELEVCDRLPADRARGHAKLAADPWRVEQEVRDRATELDDWPNRHWFAETNTDLQSDGGWRARPLLHALDPEFKMLPARQKKFRRTGRCGRGAMNLWLKTLDNVEIEEDAE
jgi:hypothetical protein